MTKKFCLLSLLLAGGGGAWWRLSVEDRLITSEHGLSTITNGGRPSVAGGSLVGTISGSPFDGTTWKPVREEGACSGGVVFSQSVGINPILFSRSSFAAVDEGG